MLFIETIEKIRREIRLQRQNGKVIAFVPTMGNLHEGHLKLIDEAKKKSDFVVCSIFVNPTQFGEGDDFDKYPRTFDQDKKLLKNRGCHLLFHPNAPEIYPDTSNKSELTTVNVPDITEELCGSSRPGHFIGVATVVCKLFNIVQPDIAIFGKKDFQQLAVIKKMTCDLNFAIKIVGVETARESNGLAMSSRNTYLTADEKNKAANIYKLLCDTKTKIIEGNLDFQKLEINARKKLEETGFTPDYFSIRDANSLKQATMETKTVVILVAAYLGKTRLIDNTSFELDKND